MLKLRQIGFADLVILNKVDLVGLENVAMIRNWIDSHLNRVRLVEAEQCDVPLDVLLAVGRFSTVHADRLSSELSPGHDAPDFDTWHYRTDVPLSKSAVRKAVRRLPAEVYRCKGFVYLSRNPTERFLLQGVGRRTSLSAAGDWGGNGPRTDLVFIGAKGSLDPEALTTMFDACRSFA